MQKNVYSVFRATPPSVGFAQLSELALSMNGNDSIPAPSPTMGTPAAIVTSPNAALSLHLRNSLFMVLVTTFVTIAFTAVTT